MILQNTAYCQQNVTGNELEALFQELDSLLGNEDDITALIRMADSLLSAPQPKYSAITARAGYISKILSAGRDFGINQFGAITGVGYMHRSGAYIDVVQYFNSAQAPAYHMSVVSLGYFFRPHVRWDFNASHDFFVFNRPEADPRFSRSIRGTSIHHRRYWDAGVDYSFLYGNETAHRIVASVNLKLKKRGWIGTDRVGFYPGASVQYGSNNVYFLRQPEPPARQLFEVVTHGNYPRLTREQFTLASILLRNGNQIALNNLLRRSGFTSSQVQQLYDDLADRQIGQEVVFGIMNYALHFPITVSKGNWGFMLNYTLNFPVALRGELYRYPVNGFYSLSVNHILPFKK